jgi:N-acetylmuramoyl-L-alanine amidase CwlA
MEIKQKLIPASDKAHRPGYKLVPKYITIHETDNTKSGADADAHARLQFNGNDRDASWHFQVDDKEIWQSIPTNEVGWACGDGSNGTGNRNSISIELCVNQDGDFEKTKQNAAWLIRHLMGKDSIPISNVVQHNKWTGKNCPRKLRASGWNSFINQIKGADTVTTKPVENMYDLSYLAGDEIKGLISSKHPDEINKKVTWAMVSRANCTLLLKRDFDLRQLQKVLNEMYPDSK